VRLARFGPARFVVAYIAAMAVLGSLATGVLLLGSRKLPVHPIRARPIRAHPAPAAPRGEATLAGVGFAVELEGAARVPLSFLANDAFQAPSLVDDGLPGVLALA
jgi:hypothetical protein